MSRLAKFVSCVKHFLANIQLTLEKSQALQKKNHS